MTAPTALQKLEVLRRHLEGESAEAIAADLGVSAEAVRALIADDPPSAKEPAPVPKREAIDPRFAGLAALRVPNTPRVLDGTRPRSNSALAAHLAAGGKIVR